MSYTAYIQSLNNFPSHDWGVWALLGFRKKQMNIVLFEKLEEIPISPKNIVVAGIGLTNQYLAQLGIPPKRALNIPQGLERFAGRQIQYMTMGEFKKRTDVPIFVKPADFAKKFDGAGVMRNTDTRHWAFQDVPDDQPVMTSEVVNFVSEYRGYVYNGKLVGVYWYIGDFRKHVDYDVFDSIIAKYNGAPAGYSIDLGLTNDGRTLLIECNDGWSLGNYGLDPEKYVNLLIARWLQLMKERNVAPGSIHYCSS